LQIDEPQIWIVATNLICAHSPPAVCAGTSLHKCAMELAAPFVYVCVHFNNKKARFTANKKHTRPTVQHVNVNFIKKRPVRLNLFVYLQGQLDALCALWQHCFFTMQTPKAADMYKKYKTVIVYICFQEHVLCAFMLDVKITFVATAVMLLFN
jgi:hypothetical protein